jgi:flap endonuclease-1
MGIANLNKLLRKNCPNVFEDIHLSEYAFKKIAIDTSLFMCKFKAICGDRWLSAFVNLVSCLRRNEIHCVFIYDNGAVQEKDIERARRVEQREKSEAKVSELENALEKYYRTNEVDDILIELYKKMDKPNKAPMRRLLGVNPNRPESEIDMELVKQKIEKMRSQILEISKEDYAVTRELFDILKVPYYLAPLEAETCCSDLCKRGLVDAVMTEDTDVLAYGANVFLSKIDTVNDTCVRIVYEDILSSLKLTSAEFTDVCIMCGCDYNTNIPKVGPETSYKHILKYRTIDEIGDKLKLDITCLNHVRTRELFTKYEQLDIKMVPFCGKPDITELEGFMRKHNINLCTEKLRKNFIHNLKIFEEDEECEYEIEDDE